ncbi:ankyrin repeat-containing domain protein [Lactarius hatsudake]|nr:ankyrin repeat-containing domain protein [Lactarius hatsudake]
MLLDRGADVHAISFWECTPIDKLFEPRTKDYHCHPQDFLDVAQLLIERGADTRRCRDALLHLASYSLELKLVRVLLDHGANVDVMDRRGRTPLHRVLGGEDYRDKDGFGIAQVLMERGADVNKPDKDHETPLHITSRLVLLEVTWLLIRHGADLHVENTEREYKGRNEKMAIRQLYRTIRASKMRSIDGPSLYGY